MDFIGPQVMFQHAAARRRLSAQIERELRAKGVSTRSRPKAAEANVCVWQYRGVVSTRSRPKAADRIDISRFSHITVSTRSRPKAADNDVGINCICAERFNTQPPEGG